MVNDPNHDRYSTSQIDTQLDIVQNRWNVDGGILVDTVPISVIDGLSVYSISVLGGIVIDYRRVTHNGIELTKRSKAWFDLYASHDWSNDVGTPTDFYIETTGISFEIVLYPKPTSADAGTNNLVVEFVKQHTTMATGTDEPFDNIPYLGAYHYGIAYHAASNLLSQDPDPVNAAKAARYLKLGDIAYADLLQHYKQFDKDEPLRLSGGRYWKY